MSNVQCFWAEHHQIFHWNVWYCKSYITSHRISEELPFWGSFMYLIQQKTQWKLTLHKIQNSNWNYQMWIQYYKRYPGKMLFPGSLNKNVKLLRQWRPAVPRSPCSSSSNTSFYFDCSVSQRMKTRPLSLNQNLNCLNCRSVTAALWSCA